MQAGEIMNVFVDINRRSRDGDNRVEFVIKLGVGKTITTTMSAEDFILAVTGRSEIPATVKTRNVSVTLAEPARKGGE